METWPVIKARHRREKLELIQAYASHFTIKETARILNMDDVQLRTFAYHNNIEFLKVYDGKTATSS